MTTLAAPPTHRARRGAARLAGGCYLAVVVFGGFAELFVRARVHVPGDAAATAAAYVADAGLARLGVAADLVQAVAFLGLALLLHRVLRHVDEGVARAMVVLVAISVAIISLNMVFQHGALLVATGGAYDLLGEPSRAAVVLLLTELQAAGYLVAGIFFGLWLLPLGWLLRRSGAYPRLLGPALAIGGLGYVVETFALLLAPEAGRLLADLAIVPGALAEVTLMGYLLTVGLRAPRDEADADV